MKLTRRTRIVKEWRRLGLQCTAQQFIDLHYDSHRVICHKLGIRATDKETWLLEKGDL